MKKLWIILITILFVSSITFAQDLILEKNPEEIIVFSGDSMFYQRETWKVELQAGENIYSWGKPISLNEEEVFIQVEGGVLLSTINDSSSQNTIISIYTDQPTTGMIHLTFPLQYLRLNYLYQFFWKPDEVAPEGRLLIDIMNQNQEAIRNTVFVIADQRLILNLEPFETKRLLVEEFQTIDAEKISRYNPSYFHDTNIHFFWDLLLPDALLFPGKAEYFEKSSAGVVFLGENYLSGETPQLRAEVGESTDVIVEEKIEKQEKLNQIFNNEGKEVLYDTREKKTYRVANRGTEKKKIEGVVPLQAGYELISHSVPLNRTEMNQISFILELEAQQEINVSIEVSGKNLTSGFVFQ
ncbi:MAG: hypothetical protein GX428_03315 [Candidatus Atribacteria bacterium]|nr:hypothetical protein [Candidatus Atribacteria bacterium]